MDSLPPRVYDDTVEILDFVLSPKARNSGPEKGAFSMKKFVGLVAAVFASAWSAPAAHATLVPRTVFAEEFGWVT